MSRVGKWIGQKLKGLIDDAGEASTGEEAWKAAVVAAANAPDQRLIDERFLESENARRAGLEAVIAELQRKNEHFFNTIEGVIKERDQWRDMFLGEGRGHLAAQLCYEETVLQLRQMLANSIRIINEYRKRDEAPLMELPFKELHDPPVGRHEVYLDLLRKMKATVPDDKDWIQERDAFSREHPDPI